MADMANMKMTRVGLIPNDWDVCQLRGHLELLTDYDANGSFADMAQYVHTEFGSGYAWYVRATDLEQNTPLSEVRYADKPSYDFLKKSKLFGGEVLVAKRGEIGKVYYFKKPQNLLATLAPNLYLLKLKDTLSSHWLYYYFKSNKGQDSLKSINASTSLGAIYKEDVKNLWIPLPSIDEQKRIAATLSRVDELITMLDDAIEKKRQIKEGLMQNLLTSATDDWKEVSFKSIYKFAKEGGTPSTSVAEYYEPATIPFAKIDDLKDKYLTKVDTYISESGLEHSSAWLLPVNCVILSNGATLGEVSINKIPVSTKQGILGIILKDEYDSEFMYYLLKGKEFKREMEKITTHGTMDCAYLKDLNTIRLRIPDLDKQRSIAKTISVVDLEIRALHSKRDKYSLIKQGMMQELLTGKTRLI